MHVERLCDALAWLLARYSSDLLINVSTGQEVSIGELAQKIGAIVGLSGRIAFDATTPDGMPRKLLASSRILTIGWRHRWISIRAPPETYRWYLSRASSDSSGPLVGP
jgi:GDP-L-fucose synthase